MSNAGRPSLARKNTRVTEERRDASLDTGLTITVNGKNYTVREGDLTSLDTMALRRETGMSFVSLMQAFTSAPDIDLIAALVWLSRRIDGERMLQFADVASEIDYTADIDVVETTEAEQDPEGPGGP